MIAFKEVGEFSFVLPWVVTGCFRTDSVRYKLQIGNPKLGQRKLKIRKVIRCHHEASNSLRMFVAGSNLCRQRGR